MYINYKVKGGIEYAMVVTSVRKGSSVTKMKPMYLGRVIDMYMTSIRTRSALYRQNTRNLRYSGKQSTPCVRTWSSLSAMSFC